MSQHLVSEACQCSSITSALCLLFITSYVFALTCAHTHTHAYKLQSSPFSFLLLFRHTHTQSYEGRMFWLCLYLIHVVPLKLHVLRIPRTDRTNLFVFAFRGGEDACVDWDRRARVTLSVKTNLNSHSRAKGSTTGVTKASCRRVRNLCAQMQVAFAKCS